MTYEDTDLKALTEILAMKLCPLPSSKPCERCSREAEEFVADVVTTVTSGSPPRLKDSQ